MQRKLLRFIAEFVIVFGLLTAMDAIRRLHALNQPIADIIVDGVAGAVLFCLITPIIELFLDRSRNSNKADI